MWEGRVLDVARSGLRVRGTTHLGVSVPSGKDPKGFVLERLSRPLGPGRGPHLAEPSLQVHGGLVCVSDEEEVYPEMGCVCLDRHSLP